MSFPRYPKYKASGVEWLGEVPAHWEVRRFQRCVFVAEGQVDPEDPRYSSMTLIAPNHVQSGTGRLLSTEGAAEQGAESGKYLCKAGDVVYSKIRPALRKACIAPVDSLCSADMYALRAHSGLTNEFLLWVILSEQFSSLVVLESQRVAMPKVNRESLKEVALPLPPVNEQKTVVGFLDRETAKIDALVAEQQRLIELLKEKRQAVISHAVTKGLDPNAKMKPSGIEWLGDVPAHWKVLPMKFLVSLRSGGTPSKENPAYWDGDVPWASSKDLKRPQLHDTEDHITQLAIDEGVAELVPIGSLLVVVRGMILAHSFPVAKVMVPMAINQDLKAVRPRELLSDAFLAWMLQGSIAETLRRLDEAAHGTKVLRLDSWTAMQLPVPPGHEQTAITAFLDLETTRIDSLVAEAERAVTLLQERRTALISAAVTGQIDVRSIEPRGTMATPLA